MQGFFFILKHKDHMNNIYVTFKAEGRHYRIICQFTGSELKVCQIGAVVPSNTLFTAIKVLQK